MKLAIITMRPKIGMKKENIAIMESYIKKQKADLYIFGELSLTGYHLKDEIRDTSEEINGPTIEYMKKVAKKNKCNIIFGMPLKSSVVKGLIYNSCIFIHSSGKVEFYNKWFLPTVGPFEEKIYFEEGDKLTLVDTNFGKIGLTICYDIFYPELFRAYSMLGADIVICISATPSVTRKYFETLIPARALENTMYFVYVNIVGTQENLVFWGGSEVRDPLANKIIQAPYYKESIKVCEIDLKEVEIARANRPFLRDIRPQIYTDLYDISRHHKLQ